MDLALTWFTPGHPVPQGSKRAFMSKSTNRPIVLDSNRIGLAEWRAQLAAYAIKAWEGRERIESSTAIRMEFYFQRPKMHFLPINSRRTELELRPSAPVYHTAPPDLDKLQRAVFDAFTDAGVWADDSLVVKVVATKLYEGYGNQPGVRVWVSRWNG
jgi:Holliday junction resolvase RusA-like endonuclease